jgi:hypothetical protein
MQYESKPYVFYSEFLVSNGQSFSYSSYSRSIDYSVQAVAILPKAQNISNQQGHRLTHIKKIKYS